jgi:deoxyhypusine synthase
MQGRRLDPRPMAAGIGVVELVDDFFLSYNAARLREACHIYTDKMLAPDVCVGLTVSGALTPTGLGSAVFVPLVEAGFVDWIVSTGANVYHDLHRSLGFSLYGIPPHADDVALRREGIIRIYDIVFDQDVLFKTDAFIAEVLKAPEFQKRMGTTGWAGTSASARNRSLPGARARQAVPCSVRPTRPVSRCIPRAPAIPASGWASQPCACRAMKSGSIPSWT